MNGSTPTNATAFAVFFFHTAVEPAPTAEQNKCDGHVSVISGFVMEAAKENDK